MIKIFNEKKELLKEYDSRFLNASFEKHIFYNSFGNERRTFIRSSIELMIDEHNSMINNKINQKLGIVNELRKSQSYLIEIEKLFETNKFLIAKKE